MMRAYDVVIKNGDVITFDQGRGRRLEGVRIGIEGDKIAAVTKRPIVGAIELDAEGKCVSPGFIDFHSHVNGRRFSAECLLRQGVTTTIGGERNFDAGIIKRIEDQGFLINHGFYISYSFTLRRAVGIKDPAQCASGSEIKNMIKLAERFFQFGALGIHIGLEYVPGTYEDELIEILKVAKKYNKVAMIHLRRDGYDAMESLEEVIRAAKATGAAVNILHVMYTAGFETLIDAFLERIETARQEGCDITADSGVYAAYPTFSGSMIWDDDWSRKYREGVSEADLLISSGVHVGEFCDKTRFDNLRRNFPATLITAFIYDEEQIVRAIQPPWMMVSSNAAYGPHLEGVGHPEGAGTFAKLLGEYVREKGALSLFDALKKITYLPAMRFGLGSKGNIKVGMDADLTIFDLKKICANSNYVSFADPNEPPDGIGAVIVNGRIVLRQKRLCDNTKNFGKLIRAKPAPYI